MKRIASIGLALAVLAAIVANASFAKEEKDPSIKEIMTKAHKGGDSLIEKLGKELKADDPKWDDIQKQSKELVGLGTSLGKNDPPKGDKESWEKLTKKYSENAKALNEAAEKKDTKAAKEAHAKFASSCMDCHKAHKPPKPEKP